MRIRSPGPAPELGPDYDGRDYLHWQMSQRPAASQFTGNVPDYSNSALDDLYGTLKKGGYNIHDEIIQAFDGTEIPALRLTQYKNKKQVDSLFRTGPTGTLYSMNPENMSSLTPITSLAMLDSQGNLNMQSPTERITSLLGGQSTFRKGLLEQGAQTVPWQRLEAQPGLDSYFGTAVQVGMPGMFESQQQEVLAKLNQSGSSHYLKFGGTGLAFNESALDVVGADIASKIKRIKTFTGKVGDTSIGIGAMLPQTSESMYFEDQLGPNMSSNFNAVFSLFSEIPEGESYSRHMFASNRFQREVRLPTGASFADGSVTLADGTTIGKGGFYGSARGFAFEEGYEHAGSARSFARGLGIPAGSYQGFSVEQLEAGSAPDRVKIGYNAYTDQFSDKFAGAKYGPMTVKDDALRMTLGGHSVAPDFLMPMVLGDLPATALKAFKANYNTTDTARNWWMNYATNVGGRDESWASSMFVDGMVKNEAKSLFMTGVQEDFLSRAQLLDRRNVPLSPMQIEAMQGKTFDLHGSTHNVLNNLREENGATFADILSPAVMSNYATALRTEGIRDKTLVKPHALSIMAQYHPELADELLERGQANLQNNMSYNIAGSFWAMGSPETRQKVEGTYGIQAFNPAAMSNLSTRTASETGLTGDSLLKEVVNRMASRSNSNRNSSIELSLPDGGSMLLPSPRAIRGALTEDKEGNLINNWAMSAVRTLTMAGEHGVSPSEESAQLLSENAGNTYTKLQEIANSQGTIQKALGVEVPKLGGVAMGAAGLEPNQAVISARAAKEYLGATSTEQARQMLQDRSLAALRYPFANPNQSIAYLNPTLYEDAPKWFREKFANPGRGFYVSPEAQAYVLGDFDKDPAVGFLSGRGADSNEAIIAGARRNVESEYTKYIDDQTERSGFRGFSEGVAHWSALERDQIREDFTNQEGFAKSKLGQVYNAMVRQMGGTMNKIAEQTFGSAEHDLSRFTAENAGLMEIYGTQSLVDRKATVDNELQNTLNLMRVQKWRSPSGFFGLKDDKWQTVGTDQVAMGQYEMQRLAKMGSNLKTEDGAFDVDQYREKLAPGIAGSMITTAEMQRLHTAGGMDAVRERQGQIGDLLTHGRANDVDMTNEILPLTGAKSFSEWAFSDVSPISGAIAGAIGARNIQKGGEAPNVGVVGDLAPVSGAVRQWKDLVEKAQNGISGALGATGGPRAMLSHIQSLFPGLYESPTMPSPSPAVGAAAAARAGMDYLNWPSRNDVFLNASSWADQGDETQRKLSQFATLNMKAMARDQGWDYATQQQNLEQFQHRLGVGFTGAGGGDPFAGDSGTKLEQTLIDTLRSADPEKAAPSRTQVRLTNQRLRATGYADLMVQDGSGNLVAADFKGKVGKNLDRDILGPTVSPKIAGQMAAYTGAHVAADGSVGYDRVLPKSIDGMATDSSKAYLFGVDLPTGPDGKALNPASISGDQYRAAAAGSYDRWHAELSGSDIPSRFSGWDQGQWDTFRNTQLPEMEAVSARLGFKPGAVRTLSGQEMASVVQQRGGDHWKIPVMSGGGYNLDQLANVAQAWASGAPMPPGMGGAGSGGGNVPPTTPAGAAAPSPGSGGHVPSGPNMGGPPGGNTYVTNMAARLQQPNFSEDTLRSGAAGLAHIEAFVKEAGSVEEAVKKLTSAHGEYRDNLVKAYDAATKMMDAGGRSDWFKGKNPDSFFASDAYNTYEQSYGKRSPEIEGMLSPMRDMFRQLGVSKAFDAMQADEPDLLGILRTGGKTGARARQEAMDAGAYDDFTGDGGPGFNRAVAGATGTLMRGYDRAIRAQGLFHAKLAFNLAAGPAFHAAEDYMEGQADQEGRLYQTGMLNYNDLMSGMGGGFLRREITRSEGRRAFGRQVYEAYSPLVNMAFGPDSTGSIFGAAAAIGMPAAGAGMGVASLTGNPLLGTLAALGVGAIGTAGYAASNSENFAAIGAFQNSQQNLLSGLVRNPEGVAGALGIGMKRAFGVLDPQEWQQYQNAAPFADLINTFGDPRAKAEATARQLGYTPGQFASGNAEAWISTQTSLGASREVAGANLQFWQTYNPQGTTPGGSINQFMAQASIGNGDVGSATIAYARARGINPFDQTRMGPLADWMTQRIAQSPNPLLASEQMVAGSGAVEQVAALQRMAGQASITPDLYNQWAIQYDEDTAQARAGVGMTGAQLGLMNPDYYNRFGRSGVRQADAAYRAGDFYSGGMIQGNTGAYEDVAGRLMMWADNPAQASAFIGGRISDTDVYRQRRDQQLQRGSPYAWGQNAGVLNSAFDTVSHGFGTFQTLNFNTGMPLIHEDLSQADINRFRAADRYNLLGGVTDAQLATATFGMSREAELIGRGQTSYEQGMQQSVRNFGRFATTGGAGLDTRGFAVGGGGLGNAAMLYQHITGQQMNLGNGMGGWQVEDAQTMLHRQQQDFSLMQQGQSLAISQQQFVVGGQQFYESRALQERGMQQNYGQTMARFSLSQRQLDYGTGYQEREMDIDRYQQVEQQGWQLEDLAYSRSQMDINFGWQQEDFDRNIRYARGREKRNLMRQQQRSTISYAMESGQADRLEDRAKTQIEWADEEFTRKKEHFEQTKRFQQEELDLSKQAFSENHKLQLDQFALQQRHFEQNRGFEAQRLSMAQEAHNRQVAWTNEERTLEDQVRLLSRQQYTVQIESQTLLTNAAIFSQSRVWALQDAVKGLGDQAQRAEAYIRLITNALPGGPGVQVSSSGASNGGSGNVITGGSTGGSTGVISNPGNINPGYPGWIPLPPAQMGAMGGGLANADLSGVSLELGPINREVVALLKRMVQLQQEGNDLPHTFQVAFDNKVVKSEPLSLSKASKARIT